MKRTHHQSWNILLIGETYISSLITSNRYINTNVDYGKKVAKKLTAFWG
jgi:hypothetical protein